jgi:hypothetical protein
MEIIKVKTKLDAPQVADFLDLYSCEDDTILVADWSGVLDASRARNGCNAVLDTLREKAYTKILNNNTKVTGHYPGAVDWVGKVWFPSMYDLGTRYFAWVYSPAFYTQLSTDEIIKLSSKVEIQTFYQVSDGWDWLTTIP